MIKLKVSTSEATAALNGLAPALSESIRKKAIRAALQPYVKTLRPVWKSARYRGKAPHRTAISAATKLASPKRMGAGPGAPIRASLGVQYGRKGGNKARGRQRIYHLLEDGFYHVHGGFRMPGSHRSRTWAQANIGRAMQAISDQIVIFARKALEGQRVG